MRARLIALAVVLLFARVAAGQQRKPELKTTRLSDKLWLLEGAGGNVAVYAWDDGVLLVDDKVEEVSPMLAAAVAAISKQPIRFILNTHWHGDHTGGNEAFARQGAVVVAHENVRRRMSVESFLEHLNRKIPASPEKALPVVTFTRDIELHLGGETISVMHVDPAHTDGDSLVRFEKANVLHMGDCYMTMSYPLVDGANGGVFQGFIAAAETGVGLSDGNTKIIPGHGAPSDQAGLKKWRDMLVAIRDRVSDGIRAKKTLQQILAEKPTKEWDVQFGVLFVKPDQVVRYAYQGLTAKR